jgi:hypothetical protein
MATTNPTITTAWAKLVNLGDDFLLTLPFTTRTSIEVAIKDSDAAPTVQGHVIRGDRIEGLNRTLLGPGYVFARCQEGSVVATLSAWTPT